MELAAGLGPFEDDRVQVGAGGVEGRGQPGRAGADDQHGAEVRGVAIGVRAPPRTSADSGAVLSNGLSHTAIPRPGRGGFGGNVWGVVLVRLAHDHRPDEPGADLCEPSQGRDQAHLLELRRSDLHPLHGGDRGRAEVPAAPSRRGGPGNRSRSSWPGRSGPVWRSRPSAGSCLRRCRSPGCCSPSPTGSWSGPPCVGRPGAALTPGSGWSPWPRSSSASEACPVGGNPFAGRLLLAYVLSGGVAFARASGAWYSGPPRPSSPVAVALG